MKILKQWLTQKFKPTPDPRLLHAVTALIRARNIAELWPVVEKHPELLSRQADKILKQRIADARKNSSDLETVLALIERRAFLRRCRKVGVKTASTEPTTGNQAQPRFGFSLRDFIKKPPKSPEGGSAHLSKQYIDLSAPQLLETDEPWEATSLMDDLNPQFRSSLLRQMPNPRVEWLPYLKQRRGRLLGMVIEICLLAALFFSVYFQVWPKEGLGSVLYQFHDNYYLWLKGKFYYSSFPYILILWYSLLCTVILILAWLWNTRLTRGLHLWLIRRAIYWRRTPWTSRALVRTVANNEYEKVLIALGEQQLKQAPKKLCRQASHLSYFTLAFEKDLRPNSYPNLSAIERWYHAYILIYAYGDRTTEWFRDCVAEMHAAFDIVAKLIPNKRDKLSQEQFHPDSILAELSEIVDIVKLNIEEGTLDDKRINHVIDTIDSRREMLDRIYLQLQMELTNPALARLRRSHHASLLAGLALEDIAITGRIAQDMVLHLASIRQKPIITLAYLDTCHSVFFLTEAFHINFEASTYRKTIFHYYACLTGNAPAMVDDLYPLIRNENVSLFMAQLKRQELTGKEDAWKRWFQFLIDRENSANA